MVVVVFFQKPQRLGKCGLVLSGSCVEREGCLKEGGRGKAIGASHSSCSSVYVNGVPVLYTGVASDVCWIQATRSVVTRLGVGF